MKLYHGITSVCSIKVRIGMAEIGLDYESVVLDLPKGDQHDPEYLKLNADGVVPTLIDGDLVLVESSLILEYLDREYHQSRLMPRGGAAEYVARHWLLRCLAIHGAINTLTFSTVMRDRTLASKSPQEIDAMLAKMPDPAMRLKRKDLLDQGLASGYIQPALKQLQRTFVDMERTLSQNDWITGPDFRIADIALMSYVDRLERLGMEGLWARSAPRIGDWLAAMQERSSYVSEVGNKIDADAAAKMRAGGQKHWQELELQWKAAIAEGSSSRAAPR